MAAGAGMADKIGRQWHRFYRTGACAGRRYCALAVANGIVLCPSGTATNGLCIVKRYAQRQVMGNRMEEINLIGQYLPRILQGAVLTLEIAVLSLVISIIIGLAGANMRLSRNRLLSRLGWLYSSVVRGVPDLIWMLMVYYSAQIGLNAITEAWELDYFEISPFAAGVLTLSFIFGAYFTETFRGAIMAIPYGQIEAGHAYGMRGMQVLRRITFPLMMRFALPSVRNNWLVLTKATALVSIIGLDDMTRIAQQAGSATHLPFIFNTVSALLFLLLTTVSLYVFRYLDKHYQRGFAREDAHV